jgi:Protein of unknown function (DUF3558)
VRSATYTSATPARSTRRARRAALGLAAAASLLLIGGCSSTTTGSGSPATGGQTGGSGGSSSSAPTSASGGSGDLHGAPNIPTPLNTTKYQAAPCTALTAAQVQQLGLGPGKTATENPQLGPGCDWATASATVGIQFVLHPTDNAQPGLKGVYASSSSTTLKRLPDVDGYPMVGPPTAPGDGSCDQFVGVSNDLDYHVITVLSANDPNYNDACGFGQKLAKATMDTMKSGA